MKRQSFDTSSNSFDKNKEYEKCKKQDGQIIFKISDVEFEIEGYESYSDYSSFINTEINGGDSLIISDRYEAQNFIYAVRKLGLSNFLDVGGGLGFYSMLFAAIKKQEQADYIVHTIEPMDYCETISTNAMLNNFNIDVHKEAICENNDIPSFLNRIGFNPDCIKIDTEGYEYEILQCANTYLRNNHPVLFLETHNRIPKPLKTFDIDSYIDLIDSMGYEMIHPITLTRFDWKSHVKNWWLSRGIFMHYSEIELLLEDED